MKVFSKLIEKNSFSCKASLCSKVGRRSYFNEYWEKKVNVGTRFISNKLARRDSMPALQPVLKGEELASVPQNLIFVAILSEFRATN